MFNFFQNKSSPILFVDGDQHHDLSNLNLNEFSKVIITCIHDIKCYPKIYLKLEQENKNVELHTVKQFNNNGKETTNKYIAMLIQKQISLGITDIKILSNDSDFYQIARMLICINDDIALNFEIMVDQKKSHKKLNQQSMIKIKYV